MAAPAHGSDLQKNRLRLRWRLRIRLRNTVLNIDFWIEATAYLSKRTGSGFNRLETDITEISSENNNVTYVSDYIQNSTENKKTKNRNTKNNLRFIQSFGYR